MSNKRDNDIDFFRGNKPRNTSVPEDNVAPKEPSISPENLEKTKVMTFDDTYTYSDFKFKKEEPVASQPEPVREVPQAPVVPTHNEQIERARRELLSKERNPYEFSDDPEIASGKRKPLMPEPGTSGSGNYRQPPVPPQKQKMPKAPKDDKKFNLGKFLFKHKKIIGTIIGIIIALLVLLYAFFSFVKPKTNFLIIGTDKRASKPNAPSRADALMNITASSKTKKMLMASIPRDTYTYVPCSYEMDKIDKITHSYRSASEDTKGKVSCTLQSVAKLVDEPTEKYVTINFDDMIGIVDAIGGVEIVSNGTFWEQNAKGKKKSYKFKNGQKYLLDGERALAYSRQRNTGEGDITRGLRQQQVFKAMLSKIKGSMFWQWPGMYAKITGMIDTNLSQLDLMQVAFIYATGGETETYKFKYNTGSIYSTQLKDNMSIVKLDDNDLKVYKNKIDELK